MTEDEPDEMPEFDAPCYVLQDVQRFPDITLPAPCMADLNAIKVGDYVRAVFQYLADPDKPPRCNSERMWVRVEHHCPRSGRILGILANDPVCMDWDNLRWGDQVTLHETNVLQINHQVPPRTLN